MYELNFITSLPNGKITLRPSIYHLISRRDIMCTTYLQDFYSFSLVTLAPYDFTSSCRQLMLQRGTQSRALITTTHHTYYPLWQLQTLASSAFLRFALYIHLRFLAPRPHRSFLSWLLPFVVTKEFTWERYDSVSLAWVTGKGINNSLI